MKKSLLFGLLAAAAAVLILSGCPTDPEIEYRDRDVEKIVPGPGALIHIDVAFAIQDDLAAALDDLAYKGKVIGVSGVITLTSALEIPSGYTVYILNGGELETDSGAGLTVGGTLWVGYGGRLASESSGSPDPVIVGANGAIKVIAGGTLTIDEPESVQNDTGGSVLGTGKVVITGDLVHVGTLADLAAVQTAWAYVTTGWLDLSGATLTTPPKPSEIASLSGISAERKLTVNTGATAETAQSLTIPAGLYLTTTDTLSTVDALEVNGSLTATNATLASGAALTVGSKGSASIGAATISTSTVNGTLVLNGDLTLDSEAVLSIANPAKVTGSEQIIADGETIKFTGINFLGNFTTDGTGIDADNLAAAVAALQSDLAVLNTHIALAEAFGTDPGNVIGTAAPTANNAGIAVTDSTNGTSGDALVITNGTTFEGAVATPTVSGTDSGIDGTKTLGVSTTDITVQDGGYTASDDKFAILTFSELVLQNHHLQISAPTFSIGLKTKRT